MSLNLLPQSTINPAFTPTPATASSVSATASAAATPTVVGSTANNPYVLPADATSVPFGQGSQPKFISAGGTVYQLGTSNGQQLSYTATNNSTQKMTLAYNGKTTNGTNIIGYDNTREQVGTEQYQVGTQKVITGYENKQTGTKKVQTGTEKYQTGTEKVQTGTKQVQTGTEKYQTGTEKVQTGTEKVKTGTEKYQDGTEKVLTGYKNVQTGTEKYQTGTQKVQTGTQQVQTGTEKYQTGTEKVLTGYNNVQTGTEKYQTGTQKVQTGTKQVQTGTEKYQTGTEKVITGYKNVQTGTEKYQTGTEKVQTGTEKVQTGTKIVGYDTKTETGSITVNRDLDGLSHGGAVGDILNQGTSLLLDANKANAFFTSNANQYRVSSLTSQDNQTNGSAENIFDNKKSDNMYVAGDPKVGGKGNNYASDTITPGTGNYTMFEHGGDTGRKVTINAQVDTINGQGNKAFTKYAFITRDDQGHESTNILQNGQLLIDGKTPLLPGQEKIIGNPADPTAKFYYASVPGGENGTNEQRLVFEFYDKPTAETRKKLIDAGAAPSQVDAMRSTFQSTYGFRVPDGKGSYRDSTGVADGMSQTYNGVKTYYDAQFNQPDSTTLPTTKTTKTPIYGPVYSEKPVYQDQPTYGERPVYTQQPVYTDKPTYGERPVYKEQPVYEDQPTYGERPVYTQQAVYTDKPTYGQRPVYETQPVYGNQPTYGERPVYTQQPVYTDKPVYKERPVYTDKPVYKDQPTYGERPVYTPKAIYEDKPTYGERPVYKEQPQYTPQPIYTNKPVYKERPVYQNVSTPIYDKKYGINVAYSNTYAPSYPTSPSQDNNKTHHDQADKPCPAVSTYGTTPPVSTQSSKDNGTVSNSNPLGALTGFGPQQFTQLIQMLNWMLQMMSQMQSH